MAYGIEQGRIPTVTLRGGERVPCLGLGTFGSDKYGPEEIAEAVYGAVTYIATKQRVDVDICTRFMKEIMNEAEEIAEHSKNSFYQVDTTVRQDNNEEILWDMVVLTVVDYVIANHEYAMIIENHLHYLLGRNFLSLSYMDGVGEREYSEKEGQQSDMDGGFQESALLFMLSEINDVEKQEVE